MWQSYNFLDSTQMLKEAQEFFLHLTLSRHFTRLFHWEDATLQGSFFPMFQEEELEGSLRLDFCPQYMGSQSQNFQFSERVVLQGKRGG